MRVLRVRLWRLRCPSRVIPPLSPELLPSRTLGHHTRAEGQREQTALFTSNTNELLQTAHGDTSILASVGFVLFVYFLSALKLNVDVA